MSNQQIVLVGFMGAGKTKVAYELGRLLDCLSVDLDELIASHEGRSPTEIIDQSGEDTFRERETERLREILDDGEARVIAAGGGAWTIAENRRLITAAGALTVWLGAPFALCWQRIGAGRAARPLARLREQAERLYYERLPIYQLADARVQVSDSESVAEVAAKVSDAISQIQPRD